MCAPTVGRKHLARYLHLLGASARDVLERDEQVVEYGRILGLLLARHSICGRTAAAAAHLLLLVVIVRRLVHAARAAGTAEALTCEAKHAGKTAEAGGTAAARSAGRRVVVVLAEEGRERIAVAEEHAEGLVRVAAPRVRALEAAGRRSAARGRARTGTAGAHLEALLAVSIEDLLLLGVAEYLVGFGDLFELLLGTRVFVLVRMVFER